MDTNLLEKFKRESYNKLNNNEKKDSIIQAIRARQKENDLSELDIEFREGLFGFDFKRKKIIIDSTRDDPYEMLTGIIHELRHQWQSEKRNLNPLNSSGYEYILSSHEADAHEYAIEEMKKYQNFFNDDEFDKYLINLEEKYLNRRNDAIYEYQRAGYYDIEEISKKMSLYSEQLAAFTAEELEEIGEPESAMAKFDNGMTVIYKLNKNNHNISFIFSGMTGTLIGNDLYIRHFSVREQMSTEDFVYLLQLYIECLEEFRDIGIDVHCTKIHFPPAIIGFGALEKNEYESFLESLNCVDNTITIEDIKSKNYDKSHVLKRTISELPDGRKITFGINYLQEYTKEQIEILEMAKEWELELDDLTHPLEEESEVAKLPVVGFFAAHQYKKDYSPRKLSLILAGQKRGLNTFYYEDLDEKQIEQLMALQLEGFKREDWAEFMQDGLNMAEIRKKLEEGRKDIVTIKAIDLDENCNIILQDSDSKKASNSQKTYSASDISAALQEMSREGLMIKTQSDLIDSIETRDSNSVEPQEKS